MQTALHTHTATHTDTPHIGEYAFAARTLRVAAFALLPKKPEPEFRIELPFSNSPLCLVSRGLTLQQSWKQTTTLH